MPTNNGNLLRQEYWIQNESGQVIGVPTQEFQYDSLNRLQSVNEGTSWKQQYYYDRYGNRRVDQNNTFGAGIPKPDFGLNTSKNQLTAPTGYTMSYDQAGNLTTDTYTGMGERTYDAENRMKQAWANNQWQSYAYDGDGRRVKRVVDGIEVWQVYGLGGELLAEYPVNGAAVSPQKEYGYRNGQLLITATASQPASGTEAVVWTNGQNVTITGNSIAKSGTSQAWNSGANSTQAIVSGDGYVEMTTSETNTDRFFGLTHTESTPSYTDIDFAVRPSSNGVVYVYEPGSGGAFGAYYSVGDKLRVALESGVVKYYLIHGTTTTLMYTATHAPTYPLSADGAFYEGGTISNAMISGTMSGGGSGGVQWLVTDQLGTPRMVFDQTGSLANVKRHDYLPFGEELFAGTGGRTTAQGYTGDGIRQKFTQKERDIETGLDYFNARYYSSSQGRFTSVDPENVGANMSEPQTWNGYNYALNNPLSFVDPDGLDVEVFWNGSSKWYTDSEFEKFKGQLRKQGFGVKNGKIYAPVFDDDGNMVGRRTIGTYESDMNSLGQGVSAELARRNDSFQRFGEVGMVYMSFFVLPASEGTLLTGWLGRALETAPTQVPRALLGTARMNLLSAVKNAKLRSFIEYLYREGATVGNGSTADAIRFERATGQLLSKIGHSPKGREAIVGLERLIRTGRLDPKDAELARQIVNDLKSALQ